MRPQLRIAVGVSGAIEENPAMPTPHDTAYPRLKSVVSERDLADIYTPTPAEREYAAQTARSSDNQLCFLVLLKTFQRLGYFLPLRDVPTAIVNHIARQLGYLLSADDFTAYDASGSRSRHMAVIRDYLQITPYNQTTHQRTLDVMRNAAHIKDDVADLINAAIEELVRQRVELPGFTTLPAAAQRSRAQVNRGYFQRVSTGLGDADRARLDQLLTVLPQFARSNWNRLRQDPRRPTLTHLKELVLHLTWLTTHNVGAAALNVLPDAKRRQFAAEARSLDAARMARLQPHKRYTLAAALIDRQAASTLDDLGEMFIKRMLKIHQSAQEALAQYRQEHQAATDELVAALADILTMLQQGGNPQKRLEDIEQRVGLQGDELLNRCTAYLAYAHNNYYPLMWKYYASHRTVLFELLDRLTLASTSQDRSVEQALDFLRQHRTSRADRLSVSQIGRDEAGRIKLIAVIDLTWIPDKWRKLVTGLPSREKLPDRIERRYFEMCVFTQVMWELKSGDLSIKGSDRFSDYRDQFISWEEYEQACVGYREQLDLPTEPTAFCNHVKTWLDAVARQTDASFPHNEAVRFVGGELFLKRLERRRRPESWAEAERLIAQRLPSVNILDALADTENWLNWTRLFGPLSGHDAKLDSPRERYLMTAFAYASYLGPSQTARALPGVDRRQLAWINQRHITEERLYEATVLVINAYNRFLLPKLWGSGKHVSADGMKWDMYEQNLLAEYHIRYGGYGGIGYYHVSDTYIALFSHFIPCGVWEAVYILDGILNNASDIQPEIIHADTQGQSTPVFALAYLLGIKLMPRIRNWKDLTFYKPQRNSHYPHTYELYSDVIDWELIQTHFPDMLRLALSIQAGRVSASTILRKLGVYSRKNRLYLAFRELGRAVRTAFLLNYIADQDLRRTIQSATNKSEAFNRFAQWLAFGSNGLIAENTRDEQRKIIKYNHLVANCLILHNVYTLTCVLQQLSTEGYPIDNEVLARLSPYATEHINRFGNYVLNLDRNTPPLTDVLTVLSKQ
jgi:TnpA family transposase